MIDIYIYIYVCVCVCVCVKPKDRKRSMSGKNDHNALWHYRNNHNAKFRVVAVLNNHNALCHVKICNDAKVVLWLLKEMTTRSSDFIKFHRVSRSVPFTATRDVRQVSICGRVSERVIELQVGVFYGHVCR